MALKLQFHKSWRIIRPRDYVRIWSKQKQTCTQGTCSFQWRIRFFISIYEKCAFLLHTNKDVLTEEEGERILYLSEEEHYSISTNRLRGWRCGIVCGCNLLLPEEYPGRHPFDAHMESDQGPRIFPTPYLQTQSLCRQRMGHFSHSLVCGCNTCKLAAWIFILASL